MEGHQVGHEELRSGDTATIENTQDSDVAICIATEDGTRIDVTLSPGQILELYAGRNDAQIIQRTGDPRGLLVIMPELPS